MELIIKNKTADEASAEEIEAPAPATQAGADVLSLFGDAGETVVHEREIEVSGTLYKFNIRELDYKSLNRINARKWRKGMGGALEFDALNADVNVTSWTLHLGVVQNSGTSEAPNWEPLFTLAQLSGDPGQMAGKKIIRPAKPGLLDNGREDARLFVFGMLGLVWEVNPSLDPTLLARIEG